jgi:23S rRNA (cytidine2498-2'-O)-methyltransferase
VTPGGQPALCAYLAPEGFEAELRDELTASLDCARGPESKIEEHGRLMIAPGPPRAVAWAQNIWCDARRIEIESIGEGARALCALQRNWVLLSTGHHRRAALIAEKLPHVSAKPLEFGAALPKAPLGSWTLLDPKTLLAAPSCTSAFAHGAAQFICDRESAPSRAYLKLWEQITLLERRPAVGERALDLGSSPGGWTWVLAKLGLRVTSVDKAPLDARIEAMAGVEFRSASAFALDPGEIGPLDWLFCDIACYPERLLTMIRRWIQAGTCPRFVCTLKFQGATDHATARAFAAIPHSRLLHLYHNKHELTWVRLPAEETLPLTPLHQ